MAVCPALENLFSQVIMGNHHELFVVLHLHKAPHFNFNYFMSS